MKRNFFYFILVILIFFETKSADFIDKGYYIVDLSNKVEWLKCTVGQYWSDKDEKCLGVAKKLNMEEIDEAIIQINDQLEGSWRLPTRKELESLICINCEKVKINLKLFPKTPPEPFWTNEKNFWQPKFNWIVNFLNGNTFGRYPGYKPNYIRLVRDRN